MMSNIEQDIELLEFINKKKIDDDNSVDYSKVLFLFSKISKISLNKPFNLFNKTSYSLTCLEMVHKIFFILLSYSKNLKLTMFLSERAIVLFTEYINLSNDLNYNDDVNLLDVKLFIYKKTIGPLILDKPSNKINALYKYIELYKDIQIKLFNILTNNFNAKNIDTIMNKMYDLIGHLIYNCFILEDTFIISELLLTISKKYLNYFEYINILKFNLEIYNFIIVNYWENRKELYLKFKIENFESSKIIEDINVSSKYLDTINNINQ